MKGKIEISVMDRNGRVMEKFDGLLGKEIQKSIYEIQNKYSFHTCEKYAGITKARSYLDAKTNTKGRSSIKLHKEGIFSFTQAVNANSSKNKEGIHVIVNADNPRYMAAVITRKDNIMVRVADRDGEVLKEIVIPALRLKNRQGMEELAGLQSEFGFSDEVLTYESISDARDYAGKVQDESGKDRKRTEKRR